MNTPKDIEEIVAKYTKLIHPQDLGEPTSKLENTLREAFEELTTLTQHHEAEVERAVKAAYEHILTELHSYNNRSNCDPEWHDGFSEAIYKVEELLAFLTPTKTDNQ